MRSCLAIATALCLAAGCDRSYPSARRNPVQVTLNADQRTCSIASEASGPNSPPEDSLGFGGRKSTGAKGEWPEARTIWAQERQQDPHIVMRFYDAEINAVRVEVAYRGPPPPRLKTVVFRHVSKSERFRLKTAAGETDYNGHSQEGEDLHLRWPEAGDGTITFLAWPHVH